MVACFSTIVGLYKRVLGIYSESHIRAIIHHLNKDVPTATFFTDSIKLLNVLKVDKENKIIQNTLRKRYILTDIFEYGKGSNSVIYTNEESNFVFKEIQFNIADPVELEQKVRELFLELFVQTVLSSDPNYGKNICKAMMCYRSENTYTISGQFNLYIQMEYLPENLNRYMQRIKIGDLAQITDMLPLFRTICTIMKYFQNTYMFSHNDLHINNIMFSGNDTLKLIDFGMSSIWYNDVHYAIEPNNIVKQPSYPRELPVYKSTEIEQSYDMLIFFASFLSCNKSKVYSDELFSYIRDIFETENGLNLYTYWEQEFTKDPTIPIFHRLYSWIIEESWPDDMKEELRISQDRYSYDGILQYLDQEKK